jgi:hypothetical protein
MPPVFTRLLAARLNEKSGLTIREGMLAKRFGRVKRGSRRATIT